MVRKSVKTLREEGFREGPMPFLYLNKATRDAELKEKQKAEPEKYFQKSVRNNIQLHPEYIEDAKAEGIEYQTGFGNTDYQRVWEVLWGIEVWSKREAF